MCDILSHSNVVSGATQTDRMSRGMYSKLGASLDDGFALVKTVGQRVEVAWQFGNEWSGWPDKTQ